MNNNTNDFLGKKEGINYKDFSPSKILAYLLNVIILEQPSIDISTLNDDSLALLIESDVEKDKNKKYLAIKVINNKFLESDLNAVDVTLSGKIKDILYFLKDPGADDHALIIQGRLGTLKKFQKIFREADFDFKVFFSNYFPEIIAEAGASAVSSGFSIGKKNKVRIDAIYDIVRASGKQLESWTFEKYLLTKEDYNNFQDKLIEVDERISTLELLLEKNSKELKFKK